MKISLAKNQLQTAEKKLNTANITMYELENRYSKKIPADNAEMKAVTDRLAAVTAQVNRAQAAAAESAEAFR